jgi:hypothetical protein
VTVALWRRRSPVLAAFAAVAAVFLVQPYDWWSRFTIPLMAIGALAIAYASVHAPTAWMRGTVRALALGLALGGVVLSSFEVDPAARAKPLPARDVIDLVGKPEKERSIGRLFFPEYRFLEQVPDDATVVVDLRAETLRFVSPLFGPNLGRSIQAFDGGGIPADAWLVTALGRPLDRLAARNGYDLVSGDGAVRAWRPPAGE